MRFGACIALCLLAGCATELDRSQTAVLDVAGKPVMLSELDRFVELSVQQETPFLSEDLMAALMEQFIEEQLLLKAADDAGITADPKRVARMMEALKRTEPAPSASVRLDDGALARSVERQARIEKLVETEVLSHLEVADEEVAAYYEERRADFVRDEAVDVSQILVEDEELAEELRRRLATENASFEELARQYSVGPEAVDGGHLGAFTRGELPPSFEVETFALAPGRLSKVVETDFGFHIFKVNGKEEEQALELEQVVDVIRVDLLRAKGDDAMARYVEELKRKYPLTVFREHLSFAFVDWEDEPKPEVEG